MAKNDSQNSVSKSEIHPSTIPTSLESNPFTPQSTISIEDLLHNINQNQDSYIVSTPPPQIIDSLSSELCTDIINDFAIKSKCTQGKAIIGITYLIQHGGTNISKKSLKITIADTIFTIDSLREAVKNAEKTATVRKFAKGIRDLVVPIAKLNHWTGPLKNNLKINNPNLEIQEEDAIWCLEVHSDNPKCPTLIRECLIRREEQLKANQSNSNSKTQNSPRKGRGKSGK
jgi:hypothetical protein